MTRSTQRRRIHSYRPHSGQNAMPDVAAKRPWWLPALLLAVLAIAIFPRAVLAAVDVRVESRPVSDPIEVFATVTSVTNGQPVGGLAVGDFDVFLDGTLIAIPQANFSLPPAQNPNRDVSVVFAMDYSPSTAGAPRIAMQDAVVAFINSMTPGDFAAIVKFNGSQGATVVQPFTEIDGGAGESMLISAATAPYDGSSTNVFDAVIRALDHFSAFSATLPIGPKAVLVISDGTDNVSVATLDSVIDAAGSDGIPIFSIALPNASTSGQQVLNSLAARTGGEYIETTDNAAVTAAYGIISTMLDNGYLLSFVSSITDCNQHSIRVEVTGQAATTVAFTRCDAPAPPPPPPPPAGGGGGGGALGVPELLAGLVALLARRRKRV